MSTQHAPLPRIPTLAGPRPHILVVRAPYYADIVAALAHGAQSVLDQAGASHDALDVAGAFELPQAIRLVLRQDPYRYQGYVALGCVIRGETDHYDFICAATLDGLMRLALDQAIALGTGLLTVASRDQAQARATPTGPNKGNEAATACLLQIAAYRFQGAPAR